MLETTASASHPSQTINLRELNSSVTVDRLMTVIGLEYLSTCCSDGRAFDSQGFHLVNPKNEYFPGTDYVTSFVLARLWRYLLNFKYFNVADLDKKIETFRSWEWIYGRSPKFVIVYNIRTDSAETKNIGLRVHFDKGIIQKIDLHNPECCRVPKDFLKFFNTLFQGEKFSLILANEFQETYCDKYGLKKKI